ncbi:DsbA family protein [Methylocaldum szegediense]|jgi:protein-disulfide isomerase|uniref:Protein-disulfide isomerase n=1 Tax=Methylocaldum szegediense TaxID=73780 RepID=A0ABN8X812_9GAMM|nr:thioredoxin domain-containing protein [Methylocaldum szegediense]CAI8887486.1 Protein-disulfide isomerase [Methylocaldum szegediense]
MWIILLMLLAVSPAARVEEVAAKIDGQAIPLAEIDTPSRAKIVRLHQALTDEAARALDRLIDRQLQASSEAKFPSPKPVTDEAIRAFRASRPEDFEGPFAPLETKRNPAAEWPAIRLYLTQKALESVQAEARRRLRAGHAIKVWLPDGPELEQPLSPIRTVALVDDTPITAEMLEQATALRLYRLRKEIYLERQRCLETSVENRLLSEEARRLGIPIEDLLAKMTRDTTVGTKELNASIESERAAGRPVSDPDRARQYLAFRKAYTRRAALVKKLRDSARIEILLEEPSLPRLPMIELNAPILGALDGPRLIAYTNYRCTPCRAAHREIDRILAAQRNVRVVFRDFIPVYDPVADEAARLSRCADRLGAFGRVRSELLGRNPPAFGEAWYTDDALRTLASRLDIDSDALVQCLSSPELGEAIEQDTAEAHELGFEEAPSFVVQGIPLSGMQSAKSLAGILRNQRYPGRLSD